MENKNDKAKKQVKKTEKKPAVKKQNPEQTGSRAKRKMLIGLCIALSVILVLLILGAAFLESTLGLIGRDVDDSTMSSSEYEEFLKNQATENATGETMDPDDVQWGNQTDPLENHDDVVNILLIGQDRRQGEGKQRSDAMILCTLNIPEKTLTMTSFMRDMYVQIPGYNDNRINSCYQVGGMELLDSCLEKNFGVVVDGNVEIDFFGFMEVIDMLGGVEMELTRSEANHLNRRGNWDVDNSTAGQWSLREGVNQLTGEQALAYCRLRYIGNGDYERTERQRKVLTAVIENCKGKSITELNGLLRKALPALTTDMSNAQIVGYALEMFPMLTDLKINTLRVPADGTYQEAVIRGMAVLVPDLDANRQLIKEAIS